LPDQVAQVGGHVVEAGDDFADGVGASHVALAGQVFAGDGVGHFGNAPQLAQQDDVEQPVVGYAYHQPGDDAPDHEPGQHAFFPVDENVGVKGEDQRHREAESQIGIQQRAQDAFVHDFSSLIVRLLKL